MTNEKLKSLFRLYLTRLDAKNNISPLSPRELDGSEQCELSTRIDFVRETQHLKHLCIEAQKLVDAGCVSKAMQRLGILQGILWARAYYTWAELRSHSLATGTCPDPEESHG
jgi:hypothetical protein